MQKKKILSINVSKHPTLKRALEKFRAEVERHAPTRVTDFVGTLQVYRISIPGSRSVFKDTVSVDFILEPYQAGK